MNDHTTRNSTNEIPHGYCHCGCGQKTKIAPYTSKRRGWIKGEPIRFVHNHHVRRPLIERFWEKVDVRGTNECWLWQAAIDVRGYGVLQVDGKVVKSHRFSWELHYGPIPDGMGVCHHCDNPPCVNPNHLWLGSHAENMRDMVEKGRQPRGKKRANTKLTPEDVRQIRDLAQTGMTQTEIAAKMGVTPSTISLIVSRRNWAWLE